MKTYIKQTAALLALFLAGGAEASVSAAGGKAESEMPIVILQRRLAPSFEMPSQLLSNQQEFKLGEQGGDSSSGREEQAVPIVLAMNRRDRSGAVQNKNDGQGRHVQQMPVLQLQPEGDEEEAPVVLMRAALPSPPLPSPGVFMVAEQQSPPMAPSNLLGFESAMARSMAKMEQEMQEQRSRMDELEKKFQAQLDAKPNVKQEQTKVNTTALTTPVVPAKSAPQSLAGVRRWPGTKKEETCEEKDEEREKEERAIAEEAMVRTGPAFRAPEPERNEEEEEPSKTASDAAVGEEKVIKSNDSKQGVEDQTKVAHLKQKRGPTHAKGNAHVNLAQQDGGANQTQNSTASAPSPAPPAASNTSANASASGNATANSTKPAGKPGAKKSKNRVKKEMDKKKEQEKKAAPPDPKPQGQQSQEKTAEQKAHEAAETEKHLLDYQKLDDMRQGQPANKATKPFNTHPTTGSIDLHQRESTTVTKK